MGQLPTHRDESALLTARLIPNELCNDFRGSVIAFHEKAGRSQGNSLFEASSSFFSVAKILLPPSSRCRHASIRTLEERIISLGACWAFSIQPVLPSVWRPVASLKSGTWPRRLTQSPELGFGFVFFLPGTILTWFCLVVFTRMPQPSCGGCCARARTLLRLPTDDAAAPPAFLQWPR